ncbi:uncharacterized protein LOC125025595 [Penaeus chinensis]|uniref:uncharacterized protein LOC125025595 n=1 Tax=Penaeus chinensis TaxID=139456 RepID=UPI001FB6A5C4|nr:uncharacterized protein LOC125025595 [Penaeus chinensis]
MSSVGAVCAEVEDEEVLLRVAAVPSPSKIEFRSEEHREVGILFSQDASCPDYDNLDVVLYEDGCTRQPWAILSKSNEYIVTLRKIDLVSEGVYRCEVMSEAPTFQTSFASANLTVVEMPGAPQIIGMQESYTVGETLRLNCTVPDSRPPARISFSVNGRLIHPGSGRITEYPRVDAGGPGHPYALSTTRSQLTLPLGERHVPAVTVECEAQVLSLTTHASHSALVRPLSTTFSFFNAGSSLPSAPSWLCAAAAFSLLALL